MSPSAEARLSDVHAVVPIRSRESAKSRLGIALDAEERDVLVLGMLANTIEALAAWRSLRAIHIVAADDDIRPLLASSGTTAGFVRQPEEGGLNEALVAARGAAAAQGATALLMLPADLPLLDVDALDHLLDAADATLAAGGGRPVVVIAPADARGGTNALLLAPPGIIEPQFGVLSFEAHLRAAAAADASVQIVHDPRLGFDLDTPDDLERLGLDRQLELQRLGERLAGNFANVAT